MLITRIDEETGQKLLWCGDKLDIMKVQKELNLSGLVIQEIREDKWGVLSPLRSRETTDGK